MTPLITAEQLNELIGSASPGLRILDVRWRLDEPNGHPAYLQGHIPGAVYVDLPTELAEHGLAATEGRHPLPSIETFRSAARRWGLNDGDTVVVYDDADNTASARAWWLLRHAGVVDVRVLDGALQAWADAGYSLETGDIEPAQGSITLKFGTMPVISMDQAATFGQGGTLLDARAAERYRGDHEPLDPQAGHIPGALNAPSTQNVGQDGRFRSPEVLREQFTNFGVAPDEPIASYCGSGVAAAHSVLSLEIAGYKAALYPGSFSQWSNHPENDVETGDQPG